MSDKTIVKLLFAGILICEIPGFIYFFWPETATIKYNLYLNKKYQDEVSVLWYTYDLSNITDRFIWAYCFCKIATERSRLLFKAMLVFMAYRVTEFGFYMWNRNSSYFNSVITYLYMLCLLILIFNDKKEAKIIKLKN